MLESPENSVAELLAAGFDLIPLRKFLKAPRDSGWRSRGYTTEELVEWLRQDGNLGIRIREDQLVLDYDPRNDFEGDSLDRFARDVELDRELVPTTRTPSGGLHLFLNVPAGTYFLNTLRDYPGLEFKGYGRQVVAPPSVHPLYLKGPRYVRDEARPAYTAVPDAPPKLLELAAQPPPKRSGGAAEVSTTYLGQLLARLEPTAFQEHEKWLELMMACHAATGGCEDARETFITWSTSDPSYADQGEVIRGRWDSLDAGAAGGVTSATLFYHVGQTGLIPPPPAEDSFDILPEEPTTDQPTNWVALFERDRNGLILPSFMNARNAVKELGIRPAQDLWWDRIVLCGDLSAIQARFPGFGEQWKDASAAAIRVILAEKWGMELSLERVHEAVDAVSQEQAFNPLLTWLRSLKWDGTKRLDHWLTTWAKVEDTPYTRACARRTILGAVARAMLPGTKFDTVLVLEGVQGIGKSTLVRTLGGPFTCEGLPAKSVHDKDVVDAIRSAWFVELDEMDSMRRNEVTALKAFITRQVDKARLPYRRVTEEFPRRCVMIGTTNDSEYLVDDTGNRRFLPVRMTEHADLTRAARERDQLFAEAVLAWQADPTEQALALPVALRGVAAAEQEQRREDDPWLDAIRGLLASKYLGHETLTSADVLQDLGIIVARQTRSDSMRLGRVLNRLGLKKGMVGAERKRVWLVPS